MIATNCIRQYVARGKRKAVTRVLLYTEPSFIALCPLTPLNLAVVISITLDKHCLE